jgi:hypothetical protein
MNEYTAALNIHEDKKEELFQTCTRILADYETARQKSGSAESSGSQDQDLITDDFGIFGPSCCVGERAYGVRLTEI